VTVLVQPNWGAVLPSLDDLNGLLLLLDELIIDELFHYHGHKLGIFRIFHHTPNWRCKAEIWRVQLHPKTAAPPVTAAHYRHNMLFCPILASTF